MQDGSKKKHKTKTIVMRKVHTGNKCMEKTSGRKHLYVFKQINIYYREHGAMRFDRLFFKFP